MLDVGCRRMYWILLDGIGCWMSLNVVGCCWISLNVCGCQCICHHMVLDVVGCHWLLLDVGCHWMLLDVVECWGYHWMFFWCRWMLLNACVRHSCSVFGWMPLGVVGCWISLNAVKRCWMLNVVGCWWMSLNVYVCRSCSVFRWMLLSVVGGHWSCALPIKMFFLINSLHLIQIRRALLECLGISLDVVSGHWWKCRTLDVVSGCWDDDWEFWMSLDVGSCWISLDVVTYWMILGVIECCWMLDVIECCWMDVGGCH